MNSIQLVNKEEPVEVHLYACGKCGTCFREQENAERCCDWKCEACGAPVPNHDLHCFECIKASANKRDKERFDKAKKVDIKDYHCEAFYVDDRFAWDECDAFEVATEDIEEEKDLPDFIWAECCKKIKFSIDFDELIENTEECYLENYEGSIGIQYVDFEELKDFIAKWNAKQIEYSWMPNGEYVKVPNPHKEKGDD